MNVCPSLTTLENAFRALLCDDTGDPDIVAHVEACENCQSWLEALVADDNTLTLDAGSYEESWACPPSEDQITAIHQSPFWQEHSAEKPFPEAASLPHVPGYEILERLDRGGMGVVYKARHTRLNRLVALKMILGGKHADADKLARFHAEAEAVARLRHPNIVAIYDIGTANGTAYLALEYLPGGSLEQLIRRGPQPPRWSAELVAILAQAIHTAHLAGIVHRDLKPANVLFAEDGTAKIADFGVAKRREAVGQTQTGQIIGTPAYMAPEQARGESKSVGPAADVYALGVIFYEALTGQPLFHGEAVMVILDKILSEDPLPPRRLIAGVPADLETVCLKALSKDPRDRYATAQELADELDQFLHDEPVRARPLSRLERACRWCLRNPSRAGMLAALTGLVLMAGLALMLAFYHAELRQAHDQTESALAGERDARRKEKRCLYVNDISLAARRYHENQLFRVRQLLDDCAAEQRGWEWHYLDRSSSAEVLSLTGHTQPVHALALAPRRPLLVSGSGDGALVFWEPNAGTRLLKLPGDAGPVWSVAFSPDGRRLASVAGSGRASGTLTILDMESSPEVQSREVFRSRAASRLGERAAVGYHPSKPLLAVATGVQVGRPGCLLLLDADGKEIRRWTGRTDQGCVALAWSPNGRHLAACFIAAESAAAKGEVIVVDPDRSEPMYRFEANGGQALALAISPDSRTLASGGADCSIELRDADAFTLRKLCSGHSGPVTSVAFTRGGQVISGSRDTTVRVWDRDSGQELFVRRGHYGPVRCVAIHPETGLIYSGSDDITIKAWHAEKSQESEVYRLHQGAATALAFSPEGDALISVGLDGAVWRIDPTGGERPRLLRQEQRSLRQVRFLPKSQTILVAGGDDEPGRSDGTIRLLDARDGRLSVELDTQLTRVSSLSVSSDGRRVSVVGRTRQHSGVVQIWDMTALPPRSDIIPPELLPGIPSAAQLYGGGDKLIVLLPQVNNFLKPSYVLIDVSEQPRLLPGTRLAINNPCFAVFTTDESLLFLGGQDPSFNKCKVGPKGLFSLARYSGHAGAICNGALSPDESLFATAGEDETIRLWDRMTNRELLALRGDPSPMSDVAFSPKGDFLAAAQGSGGIRLWNGRPRQRASGNHDWLRSRSVSEGNASLADAAGSDE